MIAIGVVLLLPGASGILFINTGGPLPALGLLIAVGGLALIVVGAQREYGRNKAREELEAPTGLRAGQRTAAMVAGVILAVVAVLLLIAWGLWRSL